MRIFFILIAVLATISNPAFAVEKIWTPEELKAELGNKQSASEFLVKGYVLLVTDCYCPPEDMCKPCSPNFLMSGTDKEYRHELYAKSLNILYDGRTRLETGKEYLVKLKTSPANTSSVELEKVIK